MNCFPELTYAIYADGELPVEEACQVETHLAVCSRCRLLVEALQAENRLLADVLQEAGEEPLPAMARPARPLDILWTALAVLATAVGLEVAVGWVADASPPESMDWLNPLTLAGQLNLFFNALFYFLEEGVAMLTSNLTTISALVLGLLALAGGLYLLRRRPATIAVLVTLVLALGLALPSAALETRIAKRGAVTIPSGQTLDDTLIVHAETVIIDGVVTGNVIAFAERVEINGTVKGDLISFAGLVPIKGTVEGNIYSFSQRLNIGGRVGQSVHAFAQHLQFDPSASVQGDALAFASEVSLDGSVGRDLMAFAGMVDMRGKVGRNVTAHTGRITLLAPAHVGGNLTTYCEKPTSVHIDPGATVVGKTEIHLTKARPSSAARYTQPKFYLRQALGVGVAFLVGLLLFWLFPALSTARLDTGGAALRAAGVGFLALVAPPIAACVVGIFLLGVGLLAGVLLIAALFPLLLLVVWLIGVYVAKIFVAVSIGQALLRPPAGQAARLAVPLLVGLVIVSVAINLPYLGGWLRFLVWLLGLGMLVIQVWRHWRQPLPTA